MLEELNDVLREVIGLGREDLAFWQMALRALIIYITAVALVRIGEKRFMGKSTAFDVILGIILGSVLSRAINGGAGFFETIVAGALLVTLHWLVAVLSYHSDTFGTAFKGSERKLVENGKVIWENMRKSHIGKNDLLGAVRSNGVSELNEVKQAHFERNGDISVIKRDRSPRIVEISVEAGVQTVRVVME